MRAYDLPEGEASSTLRIFAEVSRQELLYSAEAVRGVRTQAVRGRHTAYEALTRMLAGTSLCAWKDERTGTLAVRQRDPAPPAVRPSTTHDPPPDPSPSSMNSKALLATLVAWFATTASTNAATPTSALPEVEESLQLSPFIVSSERDNGYAATDSLAGTRLRTSLRDIAASVSVVTKDMLDDLGATNLENLLVYTTGTEVAGVAGNYSNMTTGQYSMEGESIREQVASGPSARDPSGGNNRVRGLAAADMTRNFFSSPYIPMDSYNAQSVTINRGANAILFGFGSPAGIVETSLTTPQFRNQNNVQARYGSYGTYRSSLDLERVLIKGKLAARLASVYENRHYEQDFTYRTQKRLYGVATYRPFQHTTLRVNGESGKTEQRLPRVDPPVDSLTTWWNFGQPAKVTSANNDANYKAYLMANNISGMAAQWEANPGLIYTSPYASNPTDAFPSWSTGILGGSDPGTPGVPRPTTAIAQYHSAPRSSREIEQFIYMNPISAYLMGRQLLDRSIFDYRKQLIDGPNSKTISRFNAGNAAVEQLFLGGNIGVEMTYDYQDAVQTTLRKFQWWRANNLFIDPNLYTPDGRVNPNYGRPFIASKGTAMRDNVRYETARATAFWRHDFSKTPGWFGRLLGVQTVTGLWVKHQNQAHLLSGDAAYAPGVYSGNGGRGWNDETITTVVYLGPSLANAASPKNAHIEGVRVETVYPNTFTTWVPTPTAAPGVPRGTWQQVPITIQQFPDFEHLTRENRITANDAETFAGVWQADWWNRTLVSTAGFRHDKATGYEGAWTGTVGQDPVYGGSQHIPTYRPAVTPRGQNEKDTFSYGLALHVPQKATQALPGKPRVSLYYNDSANFQITGFRANLVGDTIQPASGNTKEYGIGISGFDNKVSLRVTWYETNQADIDDKRTVGLVGKIAAVEDMIYNWVPRSTLQQRGYVGPLDAGLAPLSARYFKAWNWSFGEERIDGAQAGTKDSYYTSPTSATKSTTSMVSKGVEIEGVYNPTRQWRFSFNAYKQEAVQGTTDPVLGALVDERLAEWKKIADLPLNSGTWTGQTWVESQVLNPLNVARRQDNGPVNELRKWRANLVTNYTFSRDSRFKGFGVGGAARWQGRVMIGYPVLNDPKLGYVIDVNHPFMGPEQISYDGWLSHHRKIFGGRIDWKLQLNVRNLLDDNILIPVRANPVTAGDLVTHENVAYRIGERRTFELSSSFSF